MEENKPVHHIRSYVLRQGKLTSGQNHALEHYWPYYGVENSTNELDLERIFGRSAPLILDIGVGMGTTSVALALNHPENDYLAVEVHRPGVGSLMRQAKSANINNVRIICNDVIEVISLQIPSRSIDKIYIFFPDPWPKKRHHKRRLVNADFLSLLLPKMKTHGRIYIATDVEEFAAYLLTVCDMHEGLFNLAGKGNYAPRPEWRPLTKFEQRGLNLEHPVFDFVYCLANNIKN